MAVKSIVDIEVKTDSMKRFADLYDKFQQQLAKTPNVWKQIGGQQAAIATQFERMTAALMTQNALAREEKEAEAARLKDLRKTEQLWSSIGKHTSGIFKDTLGIGKTIIKWGGILGTAITGGAFFGFDRLADSVGNSRFQAKGLGTSIGQEKAFGVNFSRFVDTGSLLQNVMQMETNPAAATPWYTLMGGRKMTGNAAQDALALLTAERTWAKGQSVQTLGTMAAALGLPSSVEDLMRLRGTSDTEFAAQVKAYQRDQRSLNVSDRSAQGAQDFQAQMARNLGQMTAALWGALGKLSGPLSQLTASITNAGVALLGSPAVKHGIDALSDWLKNFSGSIDTNQFDAKIKTFSTDVGVVADGLHTIAGWMGKLGIGNLASGAGGAAVGARIGAMLPIPGGTLLGAAGGATEGMLAYQAYQHPDTAMKILSYIFDPFKFGVQLGGSWAKSHPGAINAARAAITSAPLVISVLNGTGGSAIVSIAGLAGTTQ